MTPAELDALIAEGERLLNAWNMAPNKTRNGSALAYFMQDNGGAILSALRQGQQDARDAARMDALELCIRDGSYLSIINDIVAMCRHAYKTIGPGPALRAAIDAAIAAEKGEQT